MWRPVRALWVTLGLLLLVGAVVLGQEDKAAEDTVPVPADKVPEIAAPGPKGETPRNDTPDQERKAPENLEEGASCVAKQCHDNLASGPSVHKPVLQQGCELCHEQQGAKHAFELAEKPPELCFMCHTDMTKNRKFVHEPLKEDDKSCTLCHNPHVGKSKIKGLLRKKTVNALCLQCHRDVARGGLYHTADKAEKGCVGCHNPHASDRPKLLRATGDGLCYKCHDAVKQEVTGGKSVHGPMSQGCRTCHDPHKSRAGKGLAKSGLALCLTCHSDFEATAAAMETRHSRLAEGAACLRCHGPHGGKYKLLLRNTSQALCLECHKDDIKSDDGTIIEGLGHLIDSGARLHGPLARGDCAGCHEPHGGAGFRFLRGSYPATFYSPYAEEAYGFCFSCHDASLARERRTASATRFRNGDLNLHYLHVNKANKGRTCRACHDPHGSKNKHYVRASVPFGEWQLPIGFVATEHGGTCSTGCHQKKSYDRINPVSYTAPQSPPVVPKESRPPSPAP
ncbi:MAG: hypothetical protein GWP05_00885 [Anaerolineaceae bacterium]|nr:hypothetical protein [Anaerolineaceae bacterium]